MEFNKLVFAGLAVGCLAAAAGGSYLATRSASAPGASGELRRDPAEAASGREGGPTAPATSAPVTESEGVISPEPSRTPSISSAPTASSRASIERPRESRGTTAPVERPRAPIAERRTPAPVESTSARATVDKPPVQTAPNSTREEARPAPAATSPSTREDARSGQSGGSMWETRAPVQSSVPEYKEAEPVAPPLPPAPEFVDLTVPSDAVLGLQIERTVSSELARLEDKVDARVTRDLRVSDRVAIPAGSTVRGSVTEVDKGGRMKGRARLAIRFHTIVLADGTQLALKTDPVIREGNSPSSESAAKVGGAAIGGAILGAILGGGKGAAIGGAVGAGAGTAAAMSNDRNPATLTAGTTVTVRMMAPVTVTVQKE
ncbi:MAG: hypothetical protein Q7R30_13290 [Acidobacteriota bacterium]|nr:hypothetical protein [Acidobacteriota bacterium]